MQQVVLVFTKLAWEEYYGPNAKIGDKLKPLHLAVLYEGSQVQSPEVFYCPAQPRVVEYPFPFYYEFYTGFGEYAWGTQLPPIPGVDAHTYVRTSYNYWTHGRKRLDEIPRKPVLIDNIQVWSVVPHRRMASQPLGLGALFGDGHVRFCVGDDLFDKTVWPQTTAWDEGPGDNRQAFDEILRRIEVNQQ